MLVLVKKAQGWRREFRMMKAERAQALSQVVEKDNELSGKLMQIKQARNYLQEERAARIKAEHERDNLQKQLRLIQDLVFSVSYCFSFVSGLFISCSVFAWMHCISKKVLQNHLINTV